MPRRDELFTADRIPTASEFAFFRGNPSVAGMAADDNKVVLNPYSPLSRQQRRAVALNEHARVWMRGNERPTFGITNEQKKLFSGYGSQQDVKDTIAARILSGDTSAGKPTPEQRDWTDSVLRSGLNMPNEQQPQQPGFLDWLQLALARGTGQSAPGDPAIYSNPAGSMGTALYDWLLRAAAMRTMGGTDPTAPGGPGMGGTNANQRKQLDQLEREGF